MINPVKIGELQMRHYIIQQTVTIYVNGVAHTFNSLEDAATKLNINVEAFKEIKVSKEHRFDNSITSCKRSSGRYKCKLTIEDLISADMVEFSFLSNLGDRFNHPEGEY